MKIILLGGAGDMGSRAVEDLATYDDVELLTIADRDVDGAQKIAKRFKDKVDVKSVDAFNHDGLVKAISGYDVAASALGPFYLFEEKIIQAALEAGVNYCSICDEWEPAETVIEKYNDQAAEKGLFMITGLGASPGLTNMAIAELARQMDKAERARVAVYLPLDCGGGEAVIYHAMHILSHPSAVWRNGSRVTIKPCAEKQNVDFPGFGSIDVWNMGHSEPVTIPRYLPGIKNVDFYMGFGTGTGTIAALARWGLFTKKTPAKFFGWCYGKIEEMSARKEPGEGSTRVDVWGETKGEKVHLHFAGTGQMRDSTGLSLAVGARMLGQKKLIVEKGGVYAPEGCLDAAGFLKRLEEKGIKAE